MGSVHLRRTASLAVLVLVGLAAGCGTIPTPAPTTTPDPSESASPGESTTPTAADCLTGRFSVVNFAASGSAGSGSGGDLTATFSDGTFALVGVGQKPVQVTISGRKAEALVNGSIRGTFTTDGSGGSYKITGNDGSARVSAGIINRTVPMSDVVSILAPDGTGSLTCTGDQATMTSSGSRLELKRG